MAATHISVVTIGEMHKRTHECIMVNSELFPNEVCFGAMSFVIDICLNGLQYISQCFGIFSVFFKN